jgi:hypothetical protein
MCPPINLRSIPLRSAAKLSQETEVNGRGGIQSGEPVQGDPSLLSERESRRES